MNSARYGLNYLSVNSQFVPIGTVAKGIEEAHGKAGTPKPTRDCYYGKDGAKLPRADNPLSADLIEQAKL